VWRILCQIWQPILAWFWAFLQQKIGYLEYYKNWFRFLGLIFFLWKFWIENYFTMDKEGASSKIFEIDCALSSPRLLPLKSSIVKWFKSVLKVILDEIIVSKKVEMLRKKLPLKSGNDSSLFLLRFNFSAFIKVARIVINFWIYFWKQKTVKKVTEVSRNGRQFAIWNV